MVVGVKTSMSSYDVIIQKGVLNEVHKYIDLDKKVLIVTDSGVPSIYVETLKRQCLSPFVFTFKCGEESKNINTYQEIISFMLYNNFTRSDIVIALGGGVVGDIAGFVASTFMRGIAFYNIPTTLLSQVDSSIGGKTAIDFNGIKNIVGAFYPPLKVIIDPDTLKTLDIRQLHSGLVEAIKMAATSNGKLFELIANSNDLFNDIETIIYEALLIKKYVVEEDEKENGLRKILNFGHTIGHAIEASNNSLLHGECVGLGMLYFASKEVKDKLIQVLKKYNLPVSIDVNKEKLLSFMVHDKKTSGDNISIILVNKLGTYEIKKVKVNDLINYL